MNNKPLLQPEKSIPIPLSLNKTAILQALYRDNKYEDEGIVIRKWEGERLSDYLASISLNDMTYQGVINKKFERKKHGLMCFNSGEKYLGDYKKNLRNNNGVYYWKPSHIKDNLYETDMYIGTWENDKMKGQGLYLCLREVLNRRDFELSEMEVYNGLFEDNKRIRGTHLLKKGSNYYIYHGDFDSNENKTDRNAYYFASSTDLLFRGSIAGNHFINGFLAYFDSEGEITDLAYCTFNEDGSNTIKTVKDQSNLNKASINEVKEDFQLFRSVVLGKNYFGNIYDKYKNTKDLIDQNANSLDVFDDEEKFPLLITAYRDYKTSNIFRDIEESVFKKEDNK